MAILSPLTYLKMWNRFQPRNRVSAIILGINAQIFARNPVSQPTEYSNEQLTINNEQLRGRKMHMHALYKGELM